jgi:hypothetical protein
MSNEHVNNAFHYALHQICPPVERDMRPIEAAIAPLATMGQPVKPPAPVTVEVSDDENTVTVTTRLEFVEARSLRCMNCYGDLSDKICENLPCQGVDRKDGRRGYFREVRG